MSLTPSCGRDRRSRPWEPGLEPGPPYSSISLLLGPRPFPPSSSLQGVGPRTPSTHLPPLESCHLLAWNASEAIGPLSVRTEDSVRTGVEMPGGWEEGRETPSPHLIPQRLQLRSPGGQASHRLSALELRSSSLWVDLVVVFASTHQIAHSHTHGPSLSYRLRNALHNGILLHSRLERGT